MPACQQPEDDAYAHLRTVPLGVRAVRRLLEKLPGQLSGREEPESKLAGA